MTINGIPER